MNSFFSITTFSMYINNCFIHNSYPPQIQICLSLNLYTKIMNISTRRLLTSITREIGGFLFAKNFFKQF